MFQITPLKTAVAPEVIKEQKMSKAADLYSFGVILWEMYHGISAWQVRKYTVKAASILSLSLQYFLKV